MTIFHKGFISAALILTMSLMAGPAVAKTLQWYHDNGITIVNQPDSAPMSYQGANGEPKGFIIDVWKKWSEKTGIPVHFHFANWEDTIRLVRDGTYDLHGGLFRNKVRLTFFDFSGPYHEVKGALLVNRQKDTDTDTIYSKFAIGVLRDAFAEYYLTKNRPQARLVPYSSMVETSRAMAEGKIDAIAGDHPMMGYEMGRIGKSNELILKEIIYSEELRAATVKGNHALIKMIDEGLAKISEHEREHIYRRWFVEDTVDNHWLRNTLIVLAILLIGVFFFFFHDWRRKQD